MNTPNTQVIQVEDSDIVGELGEESPVSIFLDLVGLAIKQGIDDPSSIFKDGTTNEGVLPIVGSAILRKLF